MRAVIVGAGQAGLAMAYALARRGLRPQRDFMLLDRARPGETSWTRRWHSLTLFTPARYSSLPGIDFPGPPDRYPRADAVSSYLDDYTHQLGLVPMWTLTATGVSLDSHGHHLELATSAGTIPTRNVIAATGPFSRPRLPQFAKAAKVPGVNLHSDDYSNPTQVPPGTVLVVGSGNTGIQIAKELAGSHRVILSSGTPSRYLPQKILGTDIFTWLRGAGLLSMPIPNQLRSRLAQDPVIGITVSELESFGVTIVNRVVGVVGARFDLADGTKVTAESVVWATGYHPGFDWLPEQVLEPNGRPIQHRGVTAIPGLFTLGVSWMRSRGSALITGVGRDAAYLAREIGRRP